MTRPTSSWRPRKWSGWRWRALRSTAGTAHERQRHGRSRPSPFRGVGDPRAARARLLALPDGRRRHLRAAVHDLRHHGRQHGGRADGQAALQPEQCRARDGAAADQQHDLRLRLAVVAAGQPLGGAGLACHHLPAGRGLRVPRDPRVPRHDPRRRRARPQRLPVGLLHPGRHPRHPCQRRPDLDPDPERARSRSRASACR